MILMAIKLVRTRRHLPEVRLSDDASTHVSRGNPNAGLPTEPLFGGLGDHERHPNGVEVVVLVGTSRRPECVQQNKPCTTSG